MVAPLTFDRVEFSYGSFQAIKPVSFELTSGLTGLVGRNGAGKTTLMRLALGILVPSRGQIQLFGRDPARDPSCRLRVGYLPQTFEPPRSTRVGDYLTTLALLSGIPRNRIRPAVKRALETVGLLDRFRSRLGSLSGGMLRRVGVAQAIMHDPEVLILDEPAAGLDPEERIRLYDTLRQFASSRPVLVSSHHVDELEREADQIWMLRRGCLTWSGTLRGALESVAGLVREGELSEQEVPLGQVITRRPTTNGVYWRVIGQDERLSVCDPTLLDAYLFHAGNEEK